MNKKYFIYNIIIAVASILVSCQNEEDFPVQHPDDYDVISFSVTAEKPITRANSYESYDNEKHSSTVGVFGFHDIEGHDFSEAASTDNSMFINTCVSYSAENKNWTYENKKYWADYSWYNSFDFIGYMPYSGNENVSFTKSSTNIYQLSFPVEFDTPIITDTKLAPTISNAPVHKTVITKVDENTTALTFDRSITLQFDQTLTGFNLQFKLDATMNKIRQFRIKEVKVYGTDIPVSGTVSRKYEWNTTNKNWIAKDITWSGIKKETYDKEHPVTIAFVDNGQDPDDTSIHDDNYNADNTLVVDADKYRKWGNDFYAIPDASFNPTIEVTYDVELVDGSNTIVTREGVVSTITLNKTNFLSYTQAGQIGKIHPINILIQPRYLYVLADEDKHTGYLLVE